MKFKRNIDNLPKLLCDDCENIPSILDEHRYTTRFIRTSDLHVLKNCELYFTNLCSDYFP